MKVNLVARGHRSDTVMARTLIVMARLLIDMARTLIVMARLDRAIGGNTMSRVMTRSSRAMTWKSVQAMTMDRGSER